MRNIAMLELVFEVTRNCNLCCKGFCMRGESQKIILNKMIINKVLGSKENNISYIHNLVLSGGEPTLEPTVIDDIVNCIIENKIKVNLLRIVTNGQIFSKQIINSLNRLDKYMKEIDKSNKKYYIILFSVDQYHNPIPKKVKEKYLLNGIDCDKNIIFSDGKMNIIKSGLNNQFGRDFRYTCKSIRYFIKEEGIFTIDELYVCANGNITSNGMGSYIDMDSNNFGNVMKLEIFDIIVKNNNSINSSNDIYSKLIEFIFKQWYNVYIKKLFDYKVNIDLVNYFQKICLSKGKGFSKIEIKKLNKYNNNLESKTIKRDYENLHIELKNLYFDMLLKLNIDENTIKSLIVYLFSNNIDFNLFYDYIKNGDYDNGKKRFI